MLTLCRPPYSLLLVEEPRTRNSSTELLSDVLHDDCTTCFVSSHRYITYSWLVWEKWLFFVVSDTDGSEEKIWVLPICRVCISLEIAQQFSSPGKILENIDKVFLKVTISALQVNFLFVLAKSYSIPPVCLQCIMEKAFCSFIFVRSLLITYLITLSLSKNLYEPWIDVWPPMTFWLLVQMLYH